MRRVISISLPDNVIAVVDYMARETKKNRSAIIRESLKHYFSETYKIDFDSQTQKKDKIPQLKIVISGQSL